VIRRISAVAALACVMITAVPAGHGPPDHELGNLSLLTNEFAYRHPTDAGAVRSRDWRVTSGSLFGGSGYLWSGHPDAGRPGPSSRPWTDSAVLRAVSTRDDYADVAVRFALRVNGLTETPRTPAAGLDGVHVMLRYRSEESVYFVSVSRRDGQYVIKRKTPGGPSNGGTYVTLAATDNARLPPARAGWRHVEATIAGSRTIVIALRIDGFPVLQATDHLAAPLPPGRVGLRGDNCDFLVRDFRVSARSTLL
jgi:hypothetical protein